MMWHNSSHSSLETDWNEPKQITNMQDLAGDFNLRTKVTEANPSRQTQRKHHSPRLRHVNDTSFQMVIGAFMYRFFIHSASQ